VTVPKRTVVIVRRTVAVAGRVTDALTGQPLAGAIVEVTGGPPEFVTKRAALAADPAWAQRAERLDRRVTRPDGWYALSDLPPGTYTLQVSVPHLGTRYQAAALLNNIAIAAPPGPNEPANPVFVHVALQPTRVKGRVTRNGGQGVAGAKVRLRGDTTVVPTDDDGRFVLSRIVAGKPTIEITAKNFQPFSQTLTLNAGQELTVDTVLNPA
jgi:protocatechuate 3,4-dioxygenase beta subunit